MDDITKKKKSPLVRIGHLEREVVRLNSSISRLAVKVRAYDPKNMLEMEKRHADLSSMFQLLIEKVTVVTEIGYSARQNKDLSADQLSLLLMATIRAVDYPDDWWRKGKTHTLKQWAQRCLDESTKGE